MGKKTLAGQRHTVAWPAGSHGWCARGPRIETRGSHYIIAHPISRQIGFFGSGVRINKVILWFILLFVCCMLRGWSLSEVTACRWYWLNIYILSTAPFFWFKTATISIVNKFSLLYIHNINVRQWQNRWPTRNLTCDLHTYSHNQVSWISERKCLKWTGWISPINMHINLKLWKFILCSWKMDENLSSIIAKLENQMSKNPPSCLQCLLLDTWNKTTGWVNILFKPDCTVFITKKLNAEFFKLIKYKTSGPWPHTM